MNGQVSRKIERKLIDRWVENHTPDGLLKLAQKSGVSSSTIARARIGDVPKKPITRQRLAKAVDATEDQLFPLVTAGVEQVS